MNFISHSLLFILALTSVVTISNAGLAVASRKPIPGWSTLSPYDRPDAHVVISLLTPHIASIKTLGSWGQTCKAACAEACKTFPLAASKRLEACLLDEDLGRMIDTLNTIRDDYCKNQAKYCLKPLQVPSCFNPAYTPEQRARCLWNLWHASQGKHGVLWPYWAKSALKDLAYAAIVGFKLRGQTENVWFREFAYRQKELLLAKIQPDDEWSVDAYSILIFMLEKIKGVAVFNSNTIVYTIALRALYHARSTLLRRIVTDGIKPHIHPKLQCVAGGVTTLEPILSRILNHLQKMQTVSEPNFPWNSLVYRGYNINPLKDMSECGDLCLGDIVNGLMGIFNPPISADDKDYLTRRLLYEALPVGPGPSDVSNHAIENVITEGMVHITSKNIIKTAIISALESRHPSQDMPGTKDSISAEQAAEWLGWQWRYLMLKYIATINRANVSVKILKFLKREKFIPTWVDYALLKKELEALAIPPWKVSVSKIKAIF